MAPIRDPPLAQACQAYVELRAAAAGSGSWKGQPVPGEDQSSRPHDNGQLGAWPRPRQCQMLPHGDIDRGGVYASFIGHYAVMAPWERELLAGICGQSFSRRSLLLHAAHEAIEKVVPPPCAWRCALSHGSWPYLRKIQ